MKFSLKQLILFVTFAAILCGVMGFAYNRVRVAQQMADQATHCVVFWDGQSRGSKHMIDIAKRDGLELRIVHY